MAAGNELLAIAAKEIGYHEEQNKRNKFGAWYGLNGQPWCMMFVQWCYWKAGMPLPCRTASCGELLRWYRANQPECIVKTPAPGCIVIFDWPGTSAATDHTGLFVSRTDKTVTTIDGNTSGTNQSNGGWVQQKTRKLSYANPTYILPWVLAKRGNMTDVDLDRLITLMTPEQAYKIVSKADLHMETLPLPVSWPAAKELNEAVELGITDGASPMLPVTRLQAAVMVKRAVKK